MRTWRASVSAPAAGRRPVVGPAPCRRDEREQDSTARRCLLALAARSPYLALVCAPRAYAIEADPRRCRSGRTGPAGFLGSRISASPRRRYGIPAGVTRATVGGSREPPCGPLGTANHPNLVGNCTESSPGRATSPSGAGWPRRSRNGRIRPSLAVSSETAATASMKPRCCSAAARRTTARRCVTATETQETPGGRQDGPPGSSHQREVAGVPRSPSARSQASRNGPDDQRPEFGESSAEYRADARPSAVNMAGRSPR